MRPRAPLSTSSHRVPPQPIRHCANAGANQHSAATCSTDRQPVRAALGLTLLSDGTVAKLKDREIELERPFVSQFGWQFEKQFFTRDSGVTMVTEWVGLVGGLDQSVLLPSLSWMVGVRTRDGAEFGVGPNVTPAGTALVLATGFTFRTGAMNIPLNAAIVPSKAGTRFTLLSGFSSRR